MDKTTAEHYFRGNDDLTVDFPARDDRPGIQNWDTTTTQSGSTVPLARKWTGDYSWIVTVVPSSNAARNGMARDPEGFAYDVSVVVFYKRVLPPDAPATSLSTANLTDYWNVMGQNERAVNATVISTGPNGGELLLTDWDTTATTSAFDGLKSGEWIMLCGPHPNSNVNSATTPPTGEPRFVLNWYQVVSIEGKETKLNALGTVYPSPTDNLQRRLITVRGAEWPWQPASNLADYSQSSNNLCVAICRGAVAVHTKSIRLENPGSSQVSFGGGGSGASTVPTHMLP